MKGILKKNPNTSDLQYKYLFENKIPFTIREGHYGKYVKFDTLMDNFKNEKGIFNDYTQILSPEEEPEYDKHAEQKKEESLQFFEQEIIKKCNTPATGTYKSKDFTTFFKKQNLNTNQNLVLLGSWNQAKNTFTATEFKCYVDCCSFTKTTKDLEVYIDMKRLNYYGYSKFDLVQYLKFLSKSEIGFEYDLRYGAIEDKFDQTFYEQDGIKTYCNNDEKYYSKLELPVDNTDYLKESNIYNQRPLNMYQCADKEYTDFAIIRIKADEAYHYITYLRFIALRYIYNQFYWNIPGLAMQIKNKLKTKVTHWQALLMAHLFAPYYNYYCFANQKVFNPKQSRYVSKDDNNLRSNLLSGSNNVDIFIDPFQSSEETIAEIKSNASNYGMNWCFKSILETYDRTTLDQFFLTKDYEGLFNYINSFKNA